MSAVGIAAIMRAGAKQVKPVACQHEINTPPGAL
jgi:hypothetical protein